MQIDIDRAEYLSKELKFSEALNLLQKTRQELENIVLKDPQDEEATTMLNEVYKMISQVSSGKINGIDYFEDQSPDHLKKLHFFELSKPEENENK